MQNDEIFTMLKGILTKDFEIPESDISLEANLYTDLDLDSIDAVDLVVRLRQITERKIDPESFKQVRTVNDVVEAIATLLKD